jgi:DNA-binding MarR family transcriptional regulator
VTQFNRFNNDHHEHWSTFIRSLCPHSDPRAARLMHDFRIVAHQIYQLGESSVETAGLSYAQYRILMHLMFCEWAGNCEGLNPSEISATQGTSRNTISALIRSLEDEGLVERQLDNDDRRRFNIHLTEAGRRKVLDNVERHVRSVEGVFDVLSDEEMETLSALLRSLNRRAIALRE